MHRLQSGLSLKEVALLASSGLKVSINRIDFPFLLVVLRVKPPGLNRLQAC